jgi:hypothetical protein
MSSKKTKKISQNQTVQKISLGIFEIRFSIEKVEIETNDKTWKNVYSKSMLQYHVLTNLAAKDDKNAIEALCTGLYGTILFFKDSEFLKRFMELINESRNGKNAVEKND